jgi:hypothetical protein
MKIRLNAAQAATLTLLTSGVLGPARAEEAIPPAPQLNGFEFCSAGPRSNGCVRFQGYIYVGRAPAAGSSPADIAEPPPAPSPPLASDRLYIHAGGDVP